MKKSRGNGLLFNADGDEDYDNVVLSQKMKIKKLQVEDLPALSRLYYQFWSEDSNLEIMNSTFRRLSNNSNYFLLGAKKDDLLIGSVMGIICEELYGECRPFMVIEDMIVDKNHRRSGAGTALMRKIERIAEKNDCSYIIFVTENDRSEAHQFYQSLGYQPNAYKGFKKRIK